MLIAARITRWLLALWLALGLASSAFAATMLIVLSDDSAVYLEAASAIEREVGNKHKTVRVMADRLAMSSLDMNDVKLVLAVGVKAAESASTQIERTPMLAVLVPRDWYLKSGRSALSENDRNVGAVVLDQPYHRQLRLIKETLPRAAKVGVIVSQANRVQLAEIEQAARSARLSINSAVIISADDLVGAMEKVLPDADALLAVPDPIALNRNTIQSLLITSYRYRDPVIGFSKSLSRAGALVSLYSTPAQVGQQAGEIALRAVTGARLSALYWPKYFSVTLNTHVARSLELDTPSEQTLQKALQEGGGE